MTDIYFCELHNVSYFSSGPLSAFLSPQREERGSKLGGKIIGYSDTRTPFPDMIVFSVRNLVILLDKYMKKEEM